MRPTAAVSPDTRPAPISYGTPARPVSYDTVCESPVVQEWLLDLPPTGSATSLARVHTRACLTVLDWSGSIHAATKIVDRVVRNAVAHGNPGTGQAAGIRLRLAVTEKRQLLIDVSDSNPSFPGFGEAALGHKERGLWEIHHLGGTLSWFLPQNADSKTVRVMLAPGPVTP
ncbi:hypothetical protein [Streptomyces sp. NBC_01022]|uniref:hypothetical protein n=1 Tax=Streptomyces sp. NBC_01022 TaxID=2903723 RepID=UPI002DDAEE51|nr:hypothetical protein [Streptomyces sp. NBC_01022]WRZ79456.1 hypothetical protein OG316_03850 [Streptomyces sp. NBC_01022]WRZ86220.1 hypothetical protein OG316_41045 [Streptomyces sp. NBC_01022]